MQSKRIKFALFIIVFALYGCVGATTEKSEIATYSANTKQNTVISVASGTRLKVYDKQLTLINPMMQDAALLNLQSNKARSLMSFRNEDGTLQSKVAVENISKKLNEKAKEDVKNKELLKKKKEEEKKKIEEAKAQGVSSAIASASVISSFTPRITTYGLDCYGCGGEDGTGNTAIGVPLSNSLGVLQPNGSWRAGIKYGNYYIIAADKSIPMCSIVKISNHGLSGSGISPNRPYYGIVLDRGGGIYGNHIDLYIGTENSKAIVPVQSTTPLAEVVRLGGQQGKGCAL